VAKPRKVVVIEPAKAPDRSAYFRQRRKAVRDRIAALAEAIGLDPKHCERCGKGSTGKGSLHWHHRDPKTKVFEIGGNYSYRCSDDEIIAELRKCERICKACHRHHHSVGGRGCIHGTKEGNVQVTFSFSADKRELAKRFRTEADALRKRMLEDALD
jgi:hypothetical protein